MHMYYNALEHKVGDDVTTCNKKQVPQEKDHLIIS